MLGHIPVMAANVAIMAGMYKNQCILENPVRKIPIQITIPKNANQIRNVSDVPFMVLLLLIEK